MQVSTAGFKEYLPQRILHAKICRMNMNETKTNQNMSSTRIRKADPADFEAVKTLYQALCNQQKYDQYTPKWQYGIYPTEEDLQHWIEIGELYLLEKDGKLAGGMLFRNETDSLSLHLFGVLPEYRHQGLARLVLTHFENEARRRGYLKVTLDIIEGNLAAKKLYESSGFRETGERDEYEEGNDWLHFHDYEKLLD